MLSPFLFCLAIDWIMKRTDIGVKSGIIWTFTESLGDLDFADAISLLAHSHRDIQSKTEKLVRNAAKVGLHVNKDKTKTMRNNCKNSAKHHSCSLLIIIGHMKFFHVLLTYIHHVLQTLLRK